MPNGNNQPFWQTGPRTNKAQDKFLRESSRNGNFARPTDLQSRVQEILARPGARTPSGMFNPRVVSSEDARLISLYEAQQSGTLVDGSLQPPPIRRPRSISPFEAVANIGAGFHRDVVQPTVGAGMWLTGYGKTLEEYEKARRGGQDIIGALGTAERSVDLPSARVNVFPGQGITLPWGGRLDEIDVGVKGALELALDPLNILPGVGFGPDILRGLNAIGKTRPAVTTALQKTIQEAPRTAKGMGDAILRTLDDLGEGAPALREQIRSARLRVGQQVSRIPRAGAAAMRVSGRPGVAGGAPRGARQAAVPLAEGEKIYKFSGTLTLTDFSPKTGRKLKPSSRPWTIEVRATSREEAMRLIREKPTLRQERLRLDREEFSGVREKPIGVDIEGNIREIGNRPGKPPGSPVEQLGTFKYDEMVAKLEADPTAARTADIHAEMKRIERNIQTAENQTRRTVAPWGTAPPGGGSYGNPVPLKSVAGRAWVRLRDLNKRYAELTGELEELGVIKPSTEIPKPAATTADPTRPTADPAKQVPDDASGGAAARETAEEAAAEELERGLITHIGNSPIGSEVLRKIFGLDPITYNPITNAGTLEKASIVVNADPVEARVRLMTQTSLDPDTMVDDLAQGFVLMRKAANEGDITEIRDLSKIMAERYTSIAQSLQLASTIDKLSPEGLFIHAAHMLNAAAEQGKSGGVARRMRAATNKLKVKEATDEARVDVASATDKVARANQVADSAAEFSRKVVTPKNTQRTKDLEYLMDDAVREVQAKLTSAERQAIREAKSILKQSVAEMDEATANSFLDRAADLKTLDGEARVKALMELIDDVRDLSQVRSNLMTGQALKPSPKLLKQQAADLKQLIDRTARKVFQQLNSVDRHAVASVKALLRRTDVELPPGMAEKFLEDAHSLRGLPIADQPAALKSLVNEIKQFDPVAKELTRKKVIADAEARVRQAARQDALDIEALIDASSRKTTRRITPPDRLAISQAKSILSRFGVELPREMAEDFLAKARALASLPDGEQAAAIRALVNEIKQFDPVKQAQEELTRLRVVAAEAKQSAKELQYLTNAELRTSKASLTNIEKKTIRSAKASLKQAGVEMSEELAQSFLDRAKALRGITNEYDQMRAAQSLLADIHSLVPGSKINAFFDVIGLPRIVQASYDLSFGLRQAIVNAWATPRRWGQMMKTGAKSFLREDVALAADRQFFERPLFKPGTEAGLDYVDRWGSISQQEEVFINRWTEKLPGIRQSNRAYIVQGNKLRADTFDDDVMRWLPDDIREEVYWGKRKFETLDELMEVTGKSRTDFELLAKWHNALTGRGNIGNFLKNNNQWLNALYYAPRFVVSRFEVPIRAVKNIATDPAMRGVVAKDLAAAIVASTAALYTLDKLPGVSVDFNPLSSDFRRIRIGPLRIDIDGGFSTMVRQVVQIAYGKRRSTTTGETYDVPRSELIGRVLTGKFSPSAGFARDVLDEEDFVGNDLDSPQAYAKRVAELWSPFVAQDVFDATQELGVIGLGTAPVGFLGGGLTTYGQGVDWTEDFKPYFAIPTDPKQGGPTRKEYREDNPEIDAKLFIIGNVTALLSKRAVREVLALIRDNDINPDDIKGINERNEARAEGDKITSDKWVDILIKQLGKSDPKDADLQEKIRQFIEEDNKKRETVVAP